MEVERQRREEEEKKQHEEYMLMKEAFTVDEEGTHEEELNQDVSQTLIKIHIPYKCKFWIISFVSSGGEYCL